MPIKTEPSYILGKVIRAARMRAGLSQKEMAVKVFKTQAIVSRWETGETIPGSMLGLVSNVCEAPWSCFNVDIDQKIDVLMRFSNGNVIALNKYNQCLFQYYGDYFDVKEVILENINPYITYKVGRTYQSALTVSESVWFTYG